MDENLNWHKHIDTQCKKISKNIALLRRTKNYMTENGLIMLYNALVLPYFTYCSTVWHQGNLTHIGKLQKLQNRAAQIITSSKYEMRSADILNKLHWEPIKRTLNHREEVMTFKALRKMTPKYISDL